MQHHLKFVSKFLFHDLDKKALIFSIMLLVFIGPDVRADPIIYFVDMQKVVDNSIAGKALRSNLEAEAKKAEIKVELARQELDKLQQELAKQQGLLSVEALNEKQESLGNKKRELERLTVDLEGGLRRKSQVELVKIVKHAKDIISQLASEERYAMIIERGARAVVFADNRFDLSDKIITLMNNETKNI